MDATTRPSEAPFWREFAEGMLRNMIRDLDPPHAGGVQDIQWWEGRVDAGPMEDILSARCLCHGRRFHTRGRAPTSLLLAVAD